jgi:GNAT superfamily N-acetyltransferase
VARYVRSADRPGIADVAVEVADDHQSIGVGTALVSRLAERGRANGIDYLSATTRWENRAARALAGAHRSPRRLEPRRRNRAGNGAPGGAASAGRAEKRRPHGGRAPHPAQR